MDNRQECLIYIFHFQQKLCSTGLLVTICFSFNMCCGKTNCKPKRLIKGFSSCYIFRDVLGTHTDLQIMKPNGCPSLNGCEWVPSIAGNLRSRSSICEGYEGYAHHILPLVLLFCLAFQAPILKLYHQRVSRCVYVIPHCFLPAIFFMLFVFLLLTSSHIEDVVFILWQVTTFPEIHSHV